MPKSVSTPNLVSTKKKHNKKWVRSLSSPGRLNTEVPKAKEIPTVVCKIEISDPPRYKLWYPLNEELATKILKSKDHFFTNKCIDKIFSEHYKGKDFLIAKELLVHLVTFSIRKSFKAIKLSSLIAVYFYTYNYTIATTWSSVDDIYKYFRDMLFRYSLEDEPHCIRIFNQFDVRDITDDFFKQYMPTLPLIQYLKWYVLVMSWKKNEPNYTGRAAQMSTSKQ